MRDLSALRGEFHGVVDQVPEHLLKPDAISQDVIPFRLKLGRDVQLLRRDRRVCRLERVFDNFVRVAIFQFEMKLAASNPGEIEQVVNQSGLQLHVALYDLNILRRTLAEVSPRYLEGMWLLPKQGSVACAVHG